jgi:inner membrane protein
MDSVTHIVLGACIGEALLGKKIGKKALIIGAAAQSIPDVDFVASFWMKPAEELLAHRGITHSFLFVLVLSPALGYVFQRLLKNSVPAINFNLFFFIEMLVHLFLDAFNNYGVGWFEPFSDLRISFNTIYVADPLMTLFPLVAAIALLLLKTHDPRRRKWWKLAVFATTIYLGICVFNKYYVSLQAAEAVAKQKLPYKSYFTTPAPLQSVLWMVVTGDENGYYVSYRSVFDRNNDFAFSYFPVNEHFLDTLAHREEVEQLKKFSNGFYTVEKWGDTLVFNDLRFGQIIGWQDPKERFVFHYFIQHPDANPLVVQRGRFAKWNWRVLRLFIKRTLGN